MTPRIVCTIKLREDFEQRLTRLIELGITCFRVNFARMTVQENMRALAVCRALASAHGAACTLFVDLPGAKPRVGRFAAGAVVLQVEHEVVLMSEPGARSDEHQIATEQFDLSALAAGDVLQAGAARLRVLEPGTAQIRCVVLTGGKIFNRNSVWVEGSTAPLGGLTARDLEIAALVAPVVEYVCPSFVEEVATVEQLARSSPARSGQIIAKIESPSGVAIIPEVSANCGGLMLCRGDLARFYDGAEMREIGLRIVEHARTGGRAAVVVFATDYLPGAAACGRVSSAEQRELLAAMRMAPDYIVFNETSVSPHWEAVARIALAAAAST